MTHTRSLTPTKAHLVVGDAQQVHAALCRAEADGRLHAVTGLRALSRNQVQLTAHLSDPAPVRDLSERAPASARTHRLRPWLLATAILVGLGAVAGVVWLAILAVTALISLVNTIIAWIGSHLVWIALAAAVLLLAGARKARGAGGAGCAGLHCGGCRR